MLVFKERLRVPHVPLFWLLLSKGYRTYLLLTNQFPHCFPRAGRPPDLVLQGIRDGIATGWWGAAFDAATGILRYATPQDCVKANVAPVDDVISQHPDVAFFLARNPGYGVGDELVCIAAVTLALPFRFAWKQLRGGASTSVGALRHRAARSAQRTAAGACAHPQPHRGRKRTSRAWPRTRADPRRMATRIAAVHI